MEEMCCLFDSPGLRVSYDAANGWLYNQWIGEHTSATIKEGAEAVYACLSRQPCTKILSDHGLLLGNWQEATAWVGQQNFARLAAQGVTHFAWVHSPLYADRAAMEHTLFFAKMPRVVIFGDMLSAYDWLLRCPKCPY